MTAHNNRDKLLEIISKLGSNTRQQSIAAANILSKETGDHIDDRTVRRWMADPDTKSARRCPGWVVRLLEIHTPEK
jgi:hypothetical protein